jgi:hypothetical protein
MVSISNYTNFQIQIYLILEMISKLSPNCLQIVSKLSPCQKETNYLLLQFNSRFKFPNGLHFKLDHLSISDLSHSRNVLQIVSKLSLCQNATNCSLLQFNCLQIVSKLSLCQNATNCSPLQFNSPFKFSKWSPKGRSGWLSV